MILLDIDGVCYNMMGALKARNPDFNGEDATDYALHNTGVSHDLLMKELQNPTVFCLQKQYTGVKEGIKKLQTLDKVVGWTTVPESVMSIREKQIAKLGLDDYKIFTGRKAIKIDGVKAIIEDNPEELERYKNTEVKRICISRVYNQNYKGADFRCIDLIDAYERLRTYYESV